MALRRGCLETFFSDNSINFHRNDNEIKETPKRFDQD